MATGKDAQNESTTDNTTTSWANNARVVAHTHSINTPHSHTWSIGTTGTGTAIPAGGYTAAPMNPNYGSTWQSAPSYVAAPTVPTEGMVVNIKDKLYRYSQATDQWIEVVNADESEIAAAPVVQIELDASGMLLALRTYRDFLDGLDGLDPDATGIVSDTLFGLDEAIGALEQL
jgi:hypothetical protein